MRRRFLAAADTARLLLDHPQLERLWDAPSALEEMTTGALCAHLGRAVTVVPGYLETQGDPPFADAPDYFLALFPQADTDLDSEMATAVRSRASGDAGRGRAGVASAWDEARQKLAARLDGDELRRGIRVRGSTMRVEDYLVTRMVELVIHADDLAASLEALPPPFDSAVTNTVISCLTEIATRRHSPLAVVRAMSRLERADPAVLRVF